MLLAGLLAGSELTSRGIVHPALWRLAHLEQVHAEKQMYRRFAMVDPWLMTATIAVCISAGVSLEETEASLTLAGGACFAVMLVLTLAGNMPINLRILRWGDEGNPDEWRRLRRRWDRIHSVRVVLDSAGFALVAAGAVLF
ncbi:MAG: DUF1772 domain-containing protein [Actinomycetota bacterium]|nr:DUF1772 domain-containing protein [Actinomycetota bacterium]